MKPSYPSLSSFLRTAWVTALVSLAALSARAQADAYPALPPGARPPASPIEPLPSEGYNNNIDATLPDRKTEQFITKVSLLQSEETRLSVIARQRAAHEQVRNFAEQIHRAGQERDQDLAQLAQRRSVLLPTGRDPHDLREENESWQTKDARDFDEDFVQRIIKIQQNAIDTLEAYEKAHDSDPELSAFAQKHLPALRENLRQAETIKKRVD